MPDFPTLQTLNAFALLLLAVLVPYTLVNLIRVLGMAHAMSPSMTCPTDDRDKTKKKKVIPGSDRATVTMVIRAIRASATCRLQHF